MLSNIQKCVVIEYQSYFLTKMFPWTRICLDIGLEMELAELLLFRDKILQYFIIFIEILDNTDFTLTIYQVMTIESKDQSLIIYSKH